MNLLDLVPAFKRSIRQHVNSTDTDSTLAAYLADGIEALNYRWTRDYEITHSPPNSYEVNPDIVAKDKRPIILMASIIYKSGDLDLASWRDGDFAYDPQQGPFNPILSDTQELDKILPPNSRKLSSKSISTAPLRGYSNVFNIESYRFWLGG